VKTGLTAALLLLSGAAFAENQETPKAGETDLSPEQALVMLREVQELMARSEDLLNDSSRGRAVDTETDILKRVNELLKDDPSVSQKKALEKIEKLMEKSEGEQKGAVEQMADVIRRIKLAGGGCCKKPGDEPGPKPKPGQQSKPVPKPGSPAPEPYDPGRTGEPINKFRSRGERTGQWGELPARIREAMLSGKRLSDDYPAEYQQVLKEYMKRLADEKD